VDENAEDFFSDGANCGVSAESTVFNSPGFRLRSIRATLAVVVAAFEHGHCRDKPLIFPDLFYIASFYSRLGASYASRVVFSLVRE
jgi:hypothetical protein